MAPNTTKLIVWHSFILGATAFWLLVAMWFLHAGML